MKLKVDGKRLSIAIMAAVVIWIALTFSWLLWHGLTIQPTLNQMPGKGPASTGDYWCAYRHGIYDKCELPEFVLGIQRDYVLFIVLQFSAPLVLLGTLFGAVSLLFEGFLLARNWQALLLLGVLSPYLDIPLFALAIYLTLGIRKKI